MKGLKLGFFLLFIACFEVYAFSACAEDGRVKGIWVECEGINRTLSSPQKLDRMINAAGDIGVNNIFLQVYRHSRSWYKTNLADDSSFQSFYKNYKIGPLKYAVIKAHKKGIKIHAWLNVYRIGKSLNVPIIKKFGRNVITRDGAGRSLIRYPLSRLPDGGYWLDPGDSSVKKYLLEVIKDLLKHYPQLDGIHLDFIRYPYSSLNPGSRWAGKKDFGYGKMSVRRFKAKYGFSPLKMDLRNRFRTQLWDAWRRRQITEFVIDAYKLAKSINPRIKVSCAVQPYPDRAYMVSYQDWRTWLRDSIVDFVILMNYTTDRKLAGYSAQSAVNLPYKSDAYIGIGAYLMLKVPQLIYLEMKDCRDLKAKGIVLFSYDALLKNKAIFKALKKQKNLW